MEEPCLLNLHINLHQGSQFLHRMVLGNFYSKQRWHIIWVIQNISENLIVTGIWWSKKIIEGIDLGRFTIFQGYRGFQRPWKPLRRKVSPWMSDMSIYTRYLNFGMRFDRKMGRWVALDNLYLTQKWHIIWIIQNGLENFIVTRIWWSKNFREKKKRKPVLRFSRFWVTSGTLETLGVAQKTYKTLRLEELCPWNSDM